MSQVKYFRTVFTKESVPCHKCRHRKHLNNRGNSGLKNCRTIFYSGRVDRNSDSERSEVPCAAYPMDININKYIILYYNYISDIR